jgi:hypothetical protein
MPRITVSTDHEPGVVAHTEWVTPADFETEHFRRHLAERLAWAVQDAARVPEPPAPQEHDAGDERAERWERGATPATSAA